MRLGAALFAVLAAFAFAAPAQADTYTVTNGSSDSTAACSGTTCPSLRAALTAAGLTRPPDTINVPAGTIHIGNDLVADSDVTIVGTSARTNIIDGGAKYRGLQVPTGNTVTLSHFTIQNGAAGAAGSTDGGAVLNVGSALTLDHVHLTNSRATRGGGLAAVTSGTTAATTIVNNSLIDGNTATTTGGGIVNVGYVETTPLSVMRLNDSTVFNNTSAAAGTGGVADINPAGVVVTTRATIADNVGGTGGVGGVSATTAGRAQLGTSILARNLVGTATVNCGAVAPSDVESNVEDKTSCAFTTGGGLDPKLAAKLSSEGGELDVLAISSASPAVDRAPAGGSCTAGTLDQRDLYRPQGSTCDAGAYELDQAATITITGGPAAGSTINTDSAQFDFSSNDPSADAVCQLTGPGQVGGFVACYKPGTGLYTGLSNGTYTFSVRDADFPTAPAASRTFTVAALDTTITGGPSGPTNDSTPTFTFTGAGGAVSFQCRVDTAAFAACTSPFTTATLAEGTHTIDVRSQSAAGGVDSTPASRSFTVDTTRPNTTLTPVSSPTNDATPTFSFTSTEASSTFQCRVDGAAYAGCTSPFTTASLPAGSHTFDVRAIDAAGNVDATPATQTFVIDLTAPDTTITAGPTGTVASTTATFTYTSTEAGSTFQCSLDSAAYGACPASYTGLAQGAHTFAVRAFDAAGNLDATPATRSWTVDTVGPDTTITGGPTGTVATTSASFTYTSSEAGSTFQCSLDSGAYGACPASYTGLAQGAHTFAVRAFDAAGNADATPATRSWTVDTVGPDTTITGGPTGTVAATTATFTYTSTEAGSTFQCSLDSAAYGACPASYTGLGQGLHTFSVRATDAAGNVDATPATRTWTVDTVAPNTTLTPVTSPGNDNTPTFSVTSSEAGSTFQCRVDSAAFAACTSPFTSAALVDGSHTFEVRATDTAGNTDPTPATQTFVIDTTAPNTTLTPIVPPFNDTTPTFTFTSNEAGSTFECRIDGAAFATCASPFTTAALTDGPHTFEVRAVDASGNTDATPAAQSFTLDSGAPSTTISDGPTGTTNDATPTFAFTSDEPNSTFTCRIDGAAFAACASPFAAPSLADGAHTFEVRATDATGNVDPTPASRAFTVDTTPPTAPDVVSGPDGPTTDSSPAFAFAAPDAASTACKLDGPGGVAGEFGPCTSPKAFNALAPGDYVFFVRSVDAAGNAQTSQRAFTVTEVSQATPTPTPAPTVTPTPTPTPLPPPVANQSVDITPVSGTVLIKLPGSKVFVKLSPSLIKNGAEVDARNGVVEITRSDGGVAKFYDGIFKLSHSGGYTVLTLTEKLTGCPKAKKSSASAAAKKPKTRKLWGDGKGKFRTKGQYSAATVRGTKWLVTDTCTTTVTKVATGVVEVQDLVKKKKTLVRAPKSYTARAKKK